jgi:hypothetical protein
MGVCIVKRPPAYDADIVFEFGVGFDYVKRDRGRIHYENGITDPQKC